MRIAIFQNGRVPVRNPTLDVSSSIYVLILIRKAKRGNSIQDNLPNREDGQHARKSQGKGKLAKDCSEYCSERRFDSVTGYEGPIKHIMSKETVTAWKAAAIMAAYIIISIIIEIMA